MAKLKQEKSWHFPTSKKLTKTEGGTNLLFPLLLHCFPIVLSTTLQETEAEPKFRVVKTDRNWPSGPSAGTAVEAKRVYTRATWESGGNADDDAMDGRLPRRFSMQVLQKTPSVQLGISRDQLKLFASNLLLPPGLF
jgi:hypothetical protein